jgi:hypothetical protein
LTQKLVSLYEFPRNKSSPSYDDTFPIRVTWFSVICVTYDSLCKYLHTFVYDDIMMTRSMYDDTFFSIRVTHFYYYMLQFERIVYTITGFSYSIKNRDKIIDMQKVT